MTLLTDPGTGRTIRVRPLSVAESLPVLWSGKQLDPAPPELAALLEYVQKIENDELLKVAAHQQLAPPPNVKARPGVKAGVRPVCDYSSNVTATLPASRAAGIGHTSRYIRHSSYIAEPARLPAEYDADDEDEQWLQQQKFTKGSVSDHPFTLDQFEKLIELFEVLDLECTQKGMQDGHHTGPGLLKASPQLSWYEASKSVKAGVAADSPGGGCNLRIARAVYDYWKRKRNNSKGPLLQRFWFERPWKALAFPAAAHGTKVRAPHSASPQVPFAASVESAAVRLPVQKVSHDEALDFLEDVRDDLEMLRTLVDQVRKREKIKRQMIRVWSEQMHIRLGRPAAAQRALVPGQPGEQIGRLADANITQQAALGHIEIQVGRPAAVRTAPVPDQPDQPHVQICQLTHPNTVPARERNTVPARERNTVPARERTDVQVGRLAAAEAGLVGDHPDDQIARPLDPRIAPALNQPLIQLVSPTAPQTGLTPEHSEQPDQPEPMSVSCTEKLLAEATAAQSACEPVLQSGVHRGQKSARKRRRLCDDTMDGHQQIQLPGHQRCTQHTQVPRHPSPTGVQHGAQLQGNQPTAGCATQGACDAVDEAPTTTSSFVSKGCAGNQRRVHAACGAAPGTRTEPGLHARAALPVVSDCVADCVADVVLCPGLAVQQADRGLMAVGLEPAKPAAVQPFQGGSTVVRFPDIMRQAQNASAAYRTTNASVLTAQTASALGQKPSLSRNSSGDISRFAFTTGWTAAGTGGGGAGTGTGTGTGTAAGAGTGGGTAAGAGTGTADHISVATAGRQDADEEAQCTASVAGVEASGRDPGAPHAACRPDAPSSGSKLTPPMQLLGAGCTEGLDFDPVPEATLPCTLQNCSEHVFASTRSKKRKGKEGYINRSKRKASGLAEVLTGNQKAAGVLKPQLQHNTTHGNHGQEEVVVLLATVLPAAGDAEECGAGDVDAEVQGIGLHTAVKVTDGKTRRQKLKHTAGHGAVVNRTFKQPQHVQRQSDHDTGSEPGPSEHPPPQKVPDRTTKRQKLNHTALQGRVVNHASKQPQHVQRQSDQHTGGDPGPSEHSPPQKEAAEVVARNRSVMMDKPRTASGGGERHKQRLGTSNDLHGTEDGHTHVHQRVLRSGAKHQHRQQVKVSSSGKVDEVNDAVGADGEDASVKADRPSSGVKVMNGVSDAVAPDGVTDGNQATVEEGSDRHSSGVHALNGVSDAVAPDGVMDGNQATVQEGSDRPSTGLNAVMPALKKSRKVKHGPKRGQSWLNQNRKSERLARLERGCGGGIRAGVSTRLRKQTFAVQKRH